ncbi:hypothetical protein GN156_15985 [bacterium LRH843]|nr:hypothetical protein [bacterium LRH843]
MRLLKPAMNGLLIAVLHRAEPLSFQEKKVRFLTFLNNLETMCAADASFKAGYEWASHSRLASSGAIVFSRKKGSVFNLFEQPIMRGEDKIV